MEQIITPNPNNEMTAEQKQTITNLLNNWIQPREIFIEHNLPLEWAAQVQEELKALETPVETTEEPV